MGLMSTAPEGASEDVSTEETADETESQPASIAEEAAPIKQESVPLPAKPLNRREQARVEREALVKDVDSLKQTLSQRDEEYRRQLSENQQMIARLMGGMEAMTRQREAASRPASQQDPSELRRKAREALDNKDLDTYERLRDEAVHIEVSEKAQKLIDSKLAEFRQSQPEPVHPVIQTLITEHKNVALAGQRGVKAVMARDSWLEGVYNMPPGPDRVRKAFELANQDLAGKTPQAQFSTNGRDALSGIAAGRANSGGRHEPAVNLPPGWEKWARDAEMSKEEYARMYADAHPEAITD